MLFAMISTLSFAQNGSISGIVTAGSDNEPAIGAVVRLNGTSLGAVTDYDGMFKISNVPTGEQTLNVAFVGFPSKEVPVTITAGQNSNIGSISLGEGSLAIKGIEVIADIAIERKTPVAASSISSEYIETKLGNQEFPEVLKVTPSVYATKGSGGAGDARINIRGFSQENLMLMINGIPVNGMEDNKVYWSNWAGLGDVTRTMNVQRGLGASKLSDAAIGGAINIITKTTDMDKGGNVFTSIGNDGYKKTGVTLSTGEFGDGWAMTVSGTRTTGNGYIEGNYNDAWSYFGSLSKDLGKHELQLTGFGAPQRHGQRDFQHSLRDQKEKYGMRWNDDFGYYNHGTNHYLEQGQFLIRENFYHKPQVGLNWYFDMNETTFLSTSVYYSVGRGGGTGDLGGYYRASDGRFRAREYRMPKDNLGHQQFNQFYLANTGQANTIGMRSLSPFVGTIDGSEGTYYIASGDVAGGLIKRGSMNEHNWYGVLSSLEKELDDAFTLTGGIDLRRYKGDHYRKVINTFGADYWFDNDNKNNQVDWFDANGNGVKDSGEMGNFVKADNDANRLFGGKGVNQRIDYSNQETIGRYGVFAQLEYDKDDLSAFISGAYNTSSMKRFDDFTSGAKESDTFNFGGGNVKLGANYNIDETHNVFVNTGFIQRAPYFDSLFPTYDNEAPNEDAKPETVVAGELGYGFRSENVSFNINGYVTKWNDKTEVASTRDSNGNTLFINLLGTDALHTGLEFDGEASVNDAISFTAMASIGSWKWANNPTGQAVDESNNPVGDVRTFLIDGLKVGDAPQTTFGLGANIEIPNSGVSISPQFLNFSNLYAAFNPSNRSGEQGDSVGSQPVKLPSYSLLDLGLVWDTQISKGLRTQVTGNVNNLTNTEYIQEATDSSRATDVLDLRGWYGRGRTYNLGMKVFFE